MTTFVSNDPKTGGEPTDEDGDGGVSEGSESVVRNGGKGAESRNHRLELNISMGKSSS